MSKNAATESRVPDGSYVCDHCGQRSKNPEWLGTTDAAERLGITVRTLYRLIDEGEIPARKFGRVIRIRAEDIDNFIELAVIQPGTLHHLYPPASGKIVAHRFERVIRIMAEDVDNFIESSVMQAGRLSHSHPPVSDKTDGGE